MAGGFGGRGLPLHARARGGEPPPETAPAEPPARPRSPARHCWVRLPVDAGDCRPGLLLEWRREESGAWSGRVVYAAELRPGRWATVEEWLDAGALSLKPD